MPSHFEVDLTEDDLVMAKASGGLRRTSNRQRLLKYVAVIAAIVFGIIMVSLGLPLASSVVGLD